MAKEALPQDLADLLVTKNFDPEYFDEQGQPTQANEAKTIKFDYVAETGKNYGTAVLVIADDDLGLYYGDNLGRGMEPDDKEEWYSFLEQLSNHATSNSVTWSPRDINQLKHTLAGIAAIKEGLFEGYYGTKKVSYMGEQTQARLVINHNRQLGENDKRFRYVESLFIETADQERFRLPFKSLSAGRAMLEHVRSGGRPYDVRGNHITEIVREMAVLSRFNRAQHHRVYEGVTQELVESARQYYQNLQETMKHLGSTRGYQAYFESWAPDQVGEAEALVENLRDMFVEQTLDARIEAALPTLAKIQQQGNNMKEAEIFENWINNLSEGTWALPETPDQMEKLNQLMSAELIVGPDATNATELLYDIVGDDELFDILNDLAEKSQGRANIWDDSDVQRRLAELGVQTPQSTEAEPADVAQDTAPAVKEGDMENANTVDINQLASQMKFLPTSKKILKYNFIPAGQRMTPMSYRLSDQDGELIKTITSTDTADKPETKNVALKGDVVMSGPSGETYVVKGAKFGKLYDGNIGGIVYPEQSPRMVAAYTGQQVVNFTAPWGESMILKPGDYLVKDGDAGYYRVAKAEYEQTYNQPGSNGQQGMAEGEMDEAVRAGYVVPDWKHTQQQGAYGAPTTQLSRPYTQAGRDELAAAVKQNRKDNKDFSRSGTPRTGAKSGSFGWDGVWKAPKDEYSQVRAQHDNAVANPKKWKMIPSAGDGKGVAEGDNMSTFEQDRELAEMLKYAGVPVSEGLLNDSTRNTWDHLLDRFRLEVEQFKQGSDLDSDLYDALYDYYHHHGAMPFKVSKASSDNSHQWVSSQFAKDMGLGENLISPMIMPVSEGSCNMTMEGEYCPEHGLMECGSMEEDGGAVGMPYSMGEGTDDPINSNSSMTGSYYEGKETNIQEGDALLARIKSLALLR